MPLLVVQEIAETVCCFTIKFHSCEYCDYTLNLLYANDLKLFTLCLIHFQYSELARQ